MLSAGLFDAPVELGVVRIEKISPKRSNMDDTTGFANPINFFI